jgi:hypothetical protein
VKRWLAVSILLVMLVGGAIFALQPKRWPSGRLHSWLLTQTPPGSDIPVVVHFLRRRGWLDDTYESRSGFLKDPPGGPQRLVGVNSVRAVLGDYRGPDGLFLFVTSTEAYFGFDQQGRLLEVWVRKTTDAP